MFSCGPNQARGSHESLVGTVVTRSSDSGDLPVGLSGLSLDSQSAGRVRLYTVGQSGTMAGRDTRVCFDENVEHPINGTTMSSDILE